MLGSSHTALHRILMQSRIRFHKLFLPWHREGWLRRQSNTILCHLYIFAEVSRQSTLYQFCWCQKRKINFEKNKCTHVPKSTENIWENEKSIVFYLLWSWIQRGITSILRFHSTEARKTMSEEIHVCCGQLMTIVWDVNNFSCNLRLKKSKARQSSRERSEEKNGQWVTIPAKVFNNLDCTPVIWK